jgi:hypothetical protein
VSKAGRRFYRSIAYGLAGLGALVWAAVDQFDIPYQDMLELFLGTVWVAGVTIALAALCVVVWIGLRKLLRRNKTD